RSERKAANRAAAAPAPSEAPAVDPLDSLSVELPPPPASSDPIGIAVPRVVRLEPVWRTPNVVAFSETPSPQPMAARTAPRGNVRFGTIEVHGSLTHQQASYAIERMQPQLRQCYLDHGPPAAANVQVELIIDDVGRVRNLQVRGAVPALAECVVQTSRKLLSGLPYSGSTKIAWNVKFE
ncbi:MAG TPA: hypothetical protein VJR89_01700, partial [Polyangiales bacterium]|nr:hypothetical protein [Polyangiales bacterium]